MKLELDEAAKADILRIAQWYEAEEFGLGDEFIVAVLEDGRAISAAPHA